MTGIMCAAVGAGNNGPLRATLNRSDISRTTNTYPSNTLSNGVCAAIGGLPPYTYAWSRISGVTAITANSPTSASTTFRSTGGNISAVFKCTVTDALGAVVDATPDLTVAFETIN